MPTFTKTAGTSFSVTTAAPATVDAAGFGALTWTTQADPCEIIDIDGWNDTWDTEEDNTYCLNDSAAQKAKRRLGEQTITLKRDKDNTAFHTLMTTAEASQTDVISCRIAHPDGTSFRYYTAQVKEYNERYGDSTQSLTVAVVLIPQIKRIEVNA